MSANTSFALTNYRLGLLTSLRDAGFTIVALVPADEGAGNLKAAGIEIHAIPIAQHGTSPVAEAKLLWAYVRHLRRIRPAAFLGFTIKPNIYGSLAARISAVPVINNITGLGLVYTRGGLLRSIVGSLYRFAFRGSYRVFFQNRESRDLFVSQGFVRPEQTALLRGSGIDLERFAPASTGETANPDLTFLLAGRLMWSKGIGEYCAAAARIRSSSSRIRFQLLGSIEPQSNRDAIPESQLEEWNRDGVEYLGSASDIRPYFAAADCIVLPSYYPEGVPRSLIEAAAMGKPIITTDTPGCRDTVEPGVTGFLCATRSIDSLTAAMLQLAGLSITERAEMGVRARKKAEREFDEQHVVNAYLAAIDAIVSK